MKYEAAILRALRYQGPERASEVFRALTGRSPHPFAVNVRLRGGFKLCYFCKRETDSFQPTCDASCVIRFNQLTPFQRKDYLTWKFPDALWLANINTEVEAFPTPQHLR